VDAATRAGPGTESEQVGDKDEDRSASEAARAVEHAPAQLGRSLDHEQPRLWARSAAVSDKDAKARAERLAIFVGLWPPTFFLLGKVLQDLEATPEEQAEQARFSAAA
jgi:hypothetical protein